MTLEGERKIDSFLIKVTQNVNLMLFENFNQKLIHLR